MSHFLDIFAPIAFFINVPLALISGIWLICTGGWHIVLAAIAAAFLCPYILGIIITPAALLLPLLEKQKTIATFFLAVLHWGVASLWGYVVITTGILWGNDLELNLIPLSILCLTTTATPYSTLLHDALRRRDDMAGCLFMVLTVLIELASIISLAVFFIAFDTIYEIREIHLATFYTFLAFSVIAVPVYWKFVLIMLSEEE